MTGTSLDGIDAALVEIEGAGLSMRARVVGFASDRFGELGGTLRALATGEAASAETISRAGHELGLATAVVISRLGSAELDLCAVHGQTLHHAPPLSWQLLNPWVIAERLRCDVVYDLRGADLAAGGQGAPITPLADAILLGGREETRVIVNLGGFCNATLLPAGARESASGGDVCACNQVLDAVARGALGMAYDAGGEHALRGRVDEHARDALVSVLEQQAASGRSLGSGDEAARWVSAHTGKLDADDLAASAADGVGRVIRRWLDEHAPGARALLAGGGVRNAALCRAIGIEEMTDTLGVPAGAREAAGMAVLGALAQDGVPITLAGVTGRRETTVLDGAWVRTRKGRG